VVLLGDRPQWRYRGLSRGGRYSDFPWLLDGGVRSENRTKASAMAPISMARPTTWPGMSVSSGVVAAVVTASMRLPLPPALEPDPGDTVGNKPVGFCGETPGTFTSGASPPPEPTSVPRPEPEPLLPLEPWPELLPEPEPEPVLVLGDGVGVGDGVGSGADASGSPGVGNAVADGLLVGAGLFGEVGDGDGDGRGATKAGENELVSTTDLGAPEPKVVAAGKWWAAATERPEPGTTAKPTANPPPSPPSAPAAIKPTRRVARSGWVGWVGGTVRPLLYRLALPRVL
jgi:hypothetical protein